MVLAYLRDMCLSQALKSGAKSKWSIICAWISTEEAAGSSFSVSRLDIGCENIEF